MNDAPSFSSESVSVVNFFCAFIYGGSIDSSRVHDFLAVKFSLFLAFCSERINKVVLGHTTKLVMIQIHCTYAHTHKDKDKRLQEQHKIHKAKMLKVVPRTNCLVKLNVSKVFFFFWSKNESKVFDIGYFGSFFLVCMEHPFDPRFLN